MKKNINHKIYNTDDCEVIGTKDAKNIFFALLKASDGAYLEYYLNNEGGEFLFISSEPEKFGQLMHLSEKKIKARI